MKNRFELTTTDGIGIFDNKLNEQIIYDGFTRETTAKAIAGLLNGLQQQIEEKPLNLHEDFDEWDCLINSIDSSSRRLIEIEEIYAEESRRILAEAIETGVDFKALYGGNNASTRKQYVDSQLTELLDEKKELEFTKSDDLRRISLLKRLIDMKIELIKYGGCDEQH